MYITCIDKQLTNDRWKTDRRWTVYDHKRALEPFAEVH